MFAVAYWPYHGMEPVQGKQANMDFVDEHQLVSQFHGHTAVDAVVGKILAKT
jgi:hypothetical protein